MYANLAYMLFQNWQTTVVCKNKKETALAFWRYQTGQQNDHWLKVNDRPMPVDRHKNYIRYSNFHQIRRNKKVAMMHLNWWCRDQNFRKYLQMRKKNNIRPSLTGFYHDAMYTENVSKAVAIAERRRKASV